jgi:hypothetical protein
MLPVTLNTNEIKDASGTEVEFGRIKAFGASVEYQPTADNPLENHRLKVSHLEVGTGSDKRRRSMVRFDRNIPASSPINYAPCSAYVVVDVPTGAILDYTGVIDLLANLQSFLSTTGAGTTVLFNGTGNGAVALTHGSL